MKTLIHFNRNLYHDCRRYRAIFAYCSREVVTLHYVLAFLQIITDTTALCCRSDRKMALMQMSSVEEAIHCLMVLN